MENYEHFKTLYKDEMGNEHHLEVKSRMDVALDVIYHCVIDGEKKIEIQMVDDKWIDLSMKDNDLAENIGLLIEHLSE